MQRPCPHGCDLPPQELQQELEEPLESKSLKAYVTPQLEHWQAWVQHIAPEAAPETLLHQVVPAEDLLALGLVNLHLDFATRRGGKASVTSRQKQTVIRASWKPSLPTEALRSEAGRRAYEWLCSNNKTYEFFVGKAQGRASEPSGWRGPPVDPNSRAAPRFAWPGSRCSAVAVPLHRLRRHRHRPATLKALGRIAAASTPSLKTSSYRKVLSRCRDYASDFSLQAFLYDVSMARTISSVVNIAESKKMAPETLASEMAAFEMYWHREGQKLEDICRQMNGRLPELFFTLAPAEWAYPLHQGALPPAKDEELSQHQILLTLHIYNTMQAPLEKAGCGRRRRFGPGAASKRSSTGVCVSNSRKGAPSTCM